MSGQQISAVPVVVAGGGIALGLIVVGVASWHKQKTLTGDKPGQAVFIAPKEKPERVKPIGEKTGVKPTKATSFAHYGGEPPSPAGVTQLKVIEHPGEGVKIRGKRVLRCPECLRGMKGGVCRIHGEIEPLDIRIPAVAEQLSEAAVTALHEELRTHPRSAMEVGEKLWLGLVLPKDVPSLPEIWQKKWIEKWGM